ncbi:MAG: sulfotransferase domain-containing protein [Gammaproteobacteria bacterium]
MYQTAIKKFSRYVVRKSAFFLPEKRQIEIERRHRGREQVSKLREADCTIVSHGKSGRTWLRVMWSRVYQARYDLPQGQLISFDNFNKKNPAIPKIFFTHDNYIGDYTGNDKTKADFRDRRVIFLARHPADITVSQYFQWKYRMRPDKKGLLYYPPHGQDVSVSEFMMNPDWGLQRVIGFMNTWAENIPSIHDFLLIRYEDLKKDPAMVLRGALEFAGTPATDSEIADAVEFGSFENMKKMEETSSFWLSGGRMKPKDKSNPSSFKVRRAKVGGFVDYFNDEEAEEIARIVDESLAPLFGYGRDRSPSGAPLSYPSSNDAD